MPKPTVTIGVEKTVQKDQVADAVRGVVGAVGGIYGCTTCGLGGFDMRLQAIDSDEFDRLAGERIAEVAEIEGVHGAVTLDG